MGFLNKHYKLTCVFVLMLNIVFISVLFRFSYPRFNVENKIEILPVVSESKYYEYIDIKSCKTDLQGYSNIIHLMVNDGYSINKSYYDTRSKYLDYELQKDDLIYRLIYNFDGLLYTFCNLYEETSVPMTYINR